MIISKEKKSKLFFKSIKNMDYLNEQLVFITMYMGIELLEDYFYETEEEYNKILKACVMLNSTYIYTCRHGYKSNYIPNYSYTEIAMFLYLFQSTGYLSKNGIVGEYHDYHIIVSYSKPESLIRISLFDKNDNKKVGTQTFSSSDEAFIGLEKIYEDFPFSI